MTTELMFVLGYFQVRFSIVVRAVAMSIYSREGILGYCLNIQKLGCDHLENTNKYFISTVSTSGLVCFRENYK